MKCKKLKRFFFIVAMCIASATSGWTQILSPVKWTYGSKKTSSVDATIFLKATIDPGWHIYSQKESDDGPLKTTFTFSPAEELVFVGSTIEPASIKKYEKVFNMEVEYFENTVVFQQKVKLKSKVPVTVKGMMEFMVCNDEKCLPPSEVEFNIVIK